MRRMLKAEVVPSLRDALGIASFTLHFRGGLSHTAASRLEFGYSIPPVSPQGRIQIHLPQRMNSLLNTRRVQSSQPSDRPRSLRHLI